MTKRELPWIAEGKTVFGLHETNNNRQLRAWLVSDRKTLGDPKALPWCGDYVETAIKKSLPKEPFPKALAENPYWARNWQHFGIPVEPVYGAIAVFVRENGGHVGFLVGQNDSDYFVLGGNQSNSVNVSRLDKNRCIATRWPSSYENPRLTLPTLSSNNIPKTTNEF
jgi:uncharacterized protein (TIGR02594 family)